MLIVITFVARYKTERQLRLSDPPAQWPRAGELSLPELSFVQALVDKAPRRASKSRLVRKLCVGGGAVSPFIFSRTPVRGRSGAAEIVDPVAVIVERPSNTVSDGLGPMAVLRKIELRSKTPLELTLWLEKARLDAVLGSCPGSLESMKSGLRCYLAFVAQCATRALCFLVMMHNWRLPSVRWRSSVCVATKAGNIAGVERVI